MNRTSQTIFETQRSNYSSGAADIYKLYLNEISSTKLLTGEEELELGRRVQCGDEEAREHMIKKQTCDWW